MITVLWLSDYDITVFSLPRHRPPQELRAIELNVGEDIPEALCSLRG
jgi:hypothetical protein